MDRQSSADRMMDTLNSRPQITSRHFAEQILNAVANSELHELDNIETFVLLNSAKDAEDVDEIFRVSSEKIDPSAIIFRPTSPAFSIKVKESMSIEMVISRLSPPQKYGINAPDDTNIWAIFSKEDTTIDQFQIEAFIIRPYEEGLKIQPHQTDTNLRYVFEPTSNKMIVHEKDDVDQIDLKSSVVVDRIKSISEAVESMANEQKKPMRNVVQKYLEILTDAVLKYLNTGKDEFIFYALLNRSTFKQQEKALRSLIWNQQSVQEILITILESNMTDFDNAGDDHDKHAFYLGMTALHAFIKEIHRQTSKK